MMQCTLSRLRQGTGIGVLLLLASSHATAAPPKSVDADTRSWWALTTELSTDAMEGRDTGSAGYDRAAALVAKRFAEAGLKPAGTNGSWLQPITFDDLFVVPARTRMTLGGQALRLNFDFALQPSLDTPARIDAAATFRGYCGPDDLAEVKDKLVVCYGSRPAPARLNGFDRTKALRAAGAAGMLLIDAPGRASEPFRAPVAYSRTVTIAGKMPPPQGPWVRGGINRDSVARFMPDASAILSAGAKGADLPHRELGRFKADIAVVRRTIHSANVLGLLPGTDPALAEQAVVVSAHLDGYGHGEVVNGDGLYNGALDNAAYVALLEQLAKRRAGNGFRRPVLFAVFTGEEKGLLGSTYYVANPTVPITAISANINLDQLRPLYPLKLMTVHGLTESSLGDHVRQVAGNMGIPIQADPEPERDLVKRSDNWPFMMAGVPATSFVFAPTDANSRARYRDWYLHRYHHPADDLTTPIDWSGARDFNRFFYALTQSVADAPQAVAWVPGKKPE